MAAGLAQASQQERPNVSGPGWLFTLAAVAVFPFDRVLAGMVGAGHGIEAICLYLGLTRAVLFDHVVRLGLSTPHDRPLRRPGARGWSALDTMRLIAWRVAGVHPETIGERLGRSANAVRAKARRLGLQPPARGTLRRLDPSTLADPVPGFGFGAPGAAGDVSPGSVCGRAAGAVSVRGAADASSVIVLRPSQPAGSPSSAHASAARPQQVRPVGQREPQLVRVIPFTQQASQPALPAISSTTEPAPFSATPQKEAEVCLSGNLSWIGAIKKPLQNRAAVWVLGMLYFGGLHWTGIAERVGKTRRATASLLHRSWLPRDRDRSKFGDRFDEEAAHATLERSGFELAYDDNQGEYYWRHRNDRAVVRQNRKRRRELGLLDAYTSETISLLTRGELDALRDKAEVPFAESSMMLQA